METALLEPFTLTQSYLHVPLMIKESEVDKQQVVTGGAFSLHVSVCLRLLVRVGAGIMVEKRIKSGVLIGLCCFGRFPENHFE